MIDLPDFLDVETWADWKKYREEFCKRKTWNEIAEKRFISRCKRFHDEGYDVNGLIDHAVDVGWVTIYPKEEFKRKTRPASHNPNPKLSVVENVNKNLGQSAIEEMKKKARGA